MATIQTYSFRQIVANFITAAQASSKYLLDFSVGTVLLSFAQSFAAIGMWLQALSLSILGLTRFSTSYGPDADSWGADFSYTRIPGFAPTGQVTFSRANTAQQAVILVGVQVQSADGSHVFNIVADPTNITGNFSVPLNGYVIPVGQPSTAALIQCTVASSLGNCSANVLTQLTSVIPYVDNVTNLAPITNGLNPETDAAFKLRFSGYLQNLSKATKAAIGYAVSQANAPFVTYYSLTENVDYTTGLARLGYFFVVADDGTGTPSAGFLSNVQAAVESSRGLTIGYTVNAPSIVLANFSVTVTTAPGFVHATVTAAIAAAVTALINTTNVGATLSYASLIQACFTAIPGSVLTVTSVTLNGSTIDVPSTNKQVIRAGAVTVS